MPCGVEIGPDTPLDVLFDQLVWTIRRIAEF
jgi:hypothetical protein